MMLGLQYLASQVAKHSSGTGHVLGPFGRAVRRLVESLLPLNDAPAAPCRRSLHNTSFFGSIS